MPPDIDGFLREGASWEEYAQRLEAALLEYVQVYGVSDRAMHAWCYGLPAPFAKALSASGTLDIDTITAQYPGRLRRATTQIDDK